MCIKAIIKQSPVELLQEKLDKLVHSKQIRFDKSPSSNLIISNTHFDSNVTSNKMILQYGPQEKSQSPVNSDLLFVVNKPADDGYNNEMKTFHEHDKQFTMINRRGKYFENIFIPHVFL